MPEIAKLMLEVESRRKTSFIVCSLGNLCEIKILPKIGVIQCRSTFPFCLVRKEPENLSSKGKVLWTDCDEKQRVSELISRR